VKDFRQLRPTEWKPTAGRDWKEVKSAILYRIEDQAANACGRGMLIEKKVVAVPPDTDVVDLGAKIQAQAMQLGLARAKEVFVVADGAHWIWNLIEEHFSQATVCRYGRPQRPDWFRFDGIRLRPVPRPIETSRPVLVSSRAGPHARHRRRAQK